MSLETALREVKIRELKPPQPVCVDESATLAEATDSMRARRAGCVLVCTNGRLEGILTERDLLNKVIGEQVSFDSPAVDFMTRAPKTLTANDLLGDAILLMNEGDYRHVPVVDEAGRIEGIISIHHIIDFLAEMFPEEVLNLPPRSDQYMDSREGG
jgi:CBS domain-containing protein